MRDSMTRRIGILIQVLLILFGLIGIYISVFEPLPSFLASALGSPSPYGSFTLKSLQLVIQFVGLSLVLFGILSVLSLIFPAIFLSFLERSDEFIVKNLARSKHELFIALSLIALAFGVYFTSFLIGFHSDDYTLLVDSEKTLHAFSHIFSLSQSHFFRPVTHIYQLFNYILFRENPYLYHSISLLLHGLASFLLYAITKKLTHDKKIGLLAAVLFCVYSVSNRSVMWISGSDIVFAGFLYLIAFYLFLVYMGNRKTGFLLLSLCFFLMGIFAKEAVISLAPFLVVVSFFVGKEKERRNSILYLIIFAAYLGFLLVLQSRSFLITENIYKLDPILIIKNFGNYTFTAFIPQGHRLLHYFPWTSHLSTVFTLIFVSFLLLKGNSIVRLTVIWYLCLVGPYLAFNLPVQPRYLYLPSFGVCVLLSLGCLFIYRRLALNAPNAKIAFHLLLTAMIALHIILINIAALRMRSETEIMKKYVQSIKNDTQKMEDMRKGNLPQDSPLTYDHLKAALKLE